MIEKEPLIQSLIYAAHLADSKKLVTASSGNISARLNDNEFLISGTGKCLGFLTDKDISLCFIDDSEKYSGAKPSMENHFHRAIYKNSPDANAVLHFQSLYATVLACSALPEYDLNFIPESVVYLKHIEVLPYFLPGSKELADEISRMSPRTDIFVLNNHGQVAVGKNLDDVLRKASIFEFACGIAVLSLNQAVRLSKKEVDELIKNYG